MDAVAHSPTLCRKRDSKLEISVGCLPSELKESQGREGRKIIKVRGKGKHQKNTAH